MTDHDPATAALPPLYAAWLDDVLGGAIPAETEATCDDCAMCPRPGEALSPRAAAQFFNPLTKCCTYLPEVHNFLAGAVLSDDDPAAAKGRDTLVARLRAGVAVTPLGLGVRRPHRLVYEASDDAFGRAVTLRCPHYLADEGGLCGVWRHRSSTCATWFCKHVRGAVGRRFWGAVQRLLAAAEVNLARACVLELDPGPEALERLFPPTLYGDQRQGSARVTAREIDGEADPELQRALWGRWHGREEDFYRACAEHVAPLAWGDVVALSGPEARIAESLVRRAWRELGSDELPAALRVGAFQTVSLDPEVTEVCTYSPYAPLALPRALVGMLHHFDGRPTDEALRAISEAEGVELDRELVLQLSDFEILVPADR
jgi:hypothetical protein